jgi:hypothetical protein
VVAVVAVLHLQLLQVILEDPAAVAAEKVKHQEEQEILLQYLHLKVNPVETQKLHPIQELAEAEPLKQEHLHQDQLLYLELVVME